MNEARANARLALAMAIGQLQETAGDDRRITVTGDQRPGSGDGKSTAATDGRRFWTGVIDSWEPDEGIDPSAWPERPDPEFISWLVSGGDERKIENTVDVGNTAGTIRLVGEGSVGANTDLFVDVAAIDIISDGGKPGGRVAWWTGDEGVKSSLGLEAKAVPGSLAEARARTQAPAVMNIGRLAGSTGGQPFSDTDFSKFRLATVTDWRQAELVGGDDGEIGTDVS